MRFRYNLEVTAGLAIALHALAASSDEPGQLSAQFVRAEQAKITIGQAILIAEKEVGGEAVEAEFEEENGRVYYDVDVRTRNGKIEVFIDPEDGAVLSVAPDN